MMRVSEVAPPSGFQEKIAEAGQRWLRANPSKEPKDLWNTVRLQGGNLCRDELSLAYNGICAYSLFRIVPEDDFQVDHFHDKRDFREKAYDWANYRLASSKRNNCKGTRVVADPFRIPRNACRLDEDMNICVDDSLSEGVADILRKSVSYLKLNDSLARNRRIMFKRYENGEIDARVLAEDAPFVAYEVMRQGLCRREGDDAIIHDTLHSIGFSWV